LRNRRGFDESLKVDLVRRERNGGRLSLLLVDLDGFKAVNDRLGHLAGNRALARCAEVLGTAVRAPDACFRWGGDEFAVLLVDSGIEAAEEVGLRVQATVAEHSYLDDGSPLSVRSAPPSSKPARAPKTSSRRPTLRCLEAKGAPYYTF
jgi:diguanylate cyclase (GGDEF)-like protein